MLSSRPRYVTAIAGAILGSFALADNVEAGATGAEVFEAQCAVCHGAAGEGGDGYETPLEGDLPPVELARVIADTMPEGEPEACVGDDALAVAEYIHERFYSPFARARNRPPKRRLSRLTARQFEQTLADLLGKPTPRGPTPARGVSVEFLRKNNVRVLGERPKRTLPKLAFRLSDYDDLPEEFYARRLGEENVRHHGNKRTDLYANARCGLEAPRTGMYEFIVRTENGFELLVNHETLIDARIRSSDQNEYRASARLIDGRVYSLELKTKRIREDDLSFEVSWIPPGGSEEPIPARRLSPQAYPPVFVAEAGLPPDDRSKGYVTAATVSAGWQDAVAAAAVEAAGAVASRPERFAGLKRGETPVPEKAIAIAAGLAERALRRPLTEGERERLVLRHIDPDDESLALDGVRRALLGVITSPRFLYPEVGAVVAEAESPEMATSHVAATRLALSLWDSLPSQGLIDAAAAGKLHTAKQVRSHAERMLRDLRTRSKLDRFFEHWLLLDRGDALSRDRSAFPDFDDRVASDMRASLEMLIDGVVWDGDGDLRQLFLTDELYLNQRLAEFLGVEAARRVEDSVDGFVLAEGDHAERVGIVTHPYMVSALAYHRETSPIHRGVFLARHVLGRSLRPPPEAVAPLAPELAPELTTRERVLVQTEPAQCQTCHVLINNLGFTLEHFDAVGRFRQHDSGRPIDATGGYVATDGADERLSGARDLAEFLADCEDVHRSFVVQLFEYMTNQPIAAYGADALRELLESFRDSGFNIRRLLIEIAVYAALADAS